MHMAWTVRIKRKVDKKLNELPPKAHAALYALLNEIGFKGPVRGNWPNYSRLGRNRHHCHIKKGNPTYVAVWEEMDDEICLVEVIYVGTHEKAPY